MAASSAYRCEMDLSPGTRSTPVTARAGDTVIRLVTRIMFNYSNLTGFEALWYLDTTCPHLRPVRVQSSLNPTR